jgi:hypothetical protein
MTNGSLLKYKATSVRSEPLAFDWILASPSSASNSLISQIAILGTSVGWLARVACHTDVDEVGEGRRHAAEADAQMAAGAVVPVRILEKICGNLLTRVQDVVDFTPQNTCAAQTLSSPLQFARLFT